MELKELEYVVAVAEEGSISKAAERLYMAQSSLSQFISRYEAELNTRLFVRTAGGVRLTQSGEVFVRNARQMLAQYRGMKEELMDMALPSRGRIEFGISSYRGSYLIPRVLRQFQKQYPNVEVVIHEHDSSALEKKLAAGELDIGLMAYWGERRPPESASVMRDEVLLIARKDHPVIQRTHGVPGQLWVEPEDTLDYEYLLSNRSTMLGTIAEALFQRCGRRAPACNENLTASFAAAMAREGLGLALTYRSCIEKRSDVEYLGIGKERCFIDLVLTYPPDGYRSRAIRALDQMVRRHIAQVEK